MNFTIIVVMRSTDNSASPKFAHMLASSCDKKNMYHLLSIIGDAFKYAKNVKLDTSTLLEDILTKDTLGFLIKPLAHKMCPSSEVLSYVWRIEQLHANYRGNLALTFGIIEYIKDYNEIRLGIMNEESQSGDPYLFYMKWKNAQNIISYNEWIGYKCLRPVARADFLFLDDFWTRSYNASDYIYMLE